MVVPERKKILIVAESINIDDSSGTKGRVALIKNLYKIGYDIQVYHYTRKDISIDNIPCFSIKENRRSFLFVLSRSERYLRNIFNIKLHKPLEKLFGFSFTLFNDRNSLISSLKKINNFEPDLILTLSKGGSFRPHHALLKMPKFHNKWMAYIHDPYPMHLYPRPYAWVEPGYGQKYKFIKEMTEKAAYHAFPSKLLKDWMGSYFSDCSEKGVIIPHQIDEEANNENIILPEYFEFNKFNILHAGNLLWGRSPEGLIKGYIKFINSDPTALENSRLLFLGGPNHYSSMLSTYAAKYCQIFVSNSYVPFKQVQKIQKETTVNVILEAKSEISPFLPGKFPHCVNSNRPILLLGPYYSESRRLLGENYRYWAEADEVEKIANLLKELYNQWQEKPSALKLDRPDLEKYLSIGSLAKTMNEVIERT